MKNLGKTSMYLRWLARLVGGLTVLLFVIFAIGEGIPQLSALSSVEAIMFTCLAIALTGVLISWRWSFAGCLLMIIGYVGFAIAGKNFTILSPFLLFPFIVILYVLAWFLDRRYVALHE